MRFLVHSMQVPNLSPEQNARLYQAMNAFYNEVPKGVTLECDYIRADKLGSYSVLDVPDRATLDRIMAPFDGLVKAEVVPVLTAQEAMGG
jgi:hypothetical protein